MFQEEQIYKFLQQKDLILLMNTISFPFNTFISYLFIILFYLLKLVSIKEIILINICVFISTFIKLLIKRKRPYKKYKYIYNLSGSKHKNKTALYSFPSGHTVTATIFILIMVHRHGYKFLYIVPFLVAFSRIYLGVHYISDVTFGLIFSIIFFIIIKKNKLLI
jgi:undecaprenyl-diphosphatase